MNETDPHILLKRSQLQSYGVLAQTCEVLVEETEYHDYSPMDEVMNNSYLLQTSVGR